MELYKKFIMWVEDVNYSDETIYAMGHEIMLDDSESPTKYELSFDFAWLNIMLGEHCFNELKQSGRVFYFYEGERNRVDLPFFEPITDEDIKKAYNEAETLTKCFNSGDDKSSVSTDVGY